MLNDARHALRRWSRRPAFAATAVLTLALGIGATTAIFSVANAVLLRPLPWPDADRLVAIYTVLPEQRSNRAAQTTWDRSPVTWPTWKELAASPAFERVGAWISNQYTEGEGRSEIVPLAHVSSAVFQILGATPAAGRFFTASEDDTAERVVVLSHETWQRRFGGRPGAMGEAVHLAFANPEARPMQHTIVGVLPPGFQMGQDTPEFVLPIGLAPISWRETDQLSLKVTAKLAADVSIAAASSAAAPIVRRGLPPEQRSSRIVLLGDDLFGDAGSQIVLLLAGAGVLLMMSCANVAGLLLGDGWSRRPEVAVRLALGAEPRRLLRQLAVEHVMLAGAASVAGLALAIWLTPAFIAIAPGSLPQLDATGLLDGRVMAFAIALGIVTAAIFGIAPSVTLASTPAAHILAVSGREGSPRQHHAQRFAVVAQLALALVLIVGASLLGETIVRLTSQPLGFEPGNLAVVSADYMGPTTRMSPDQPPASVRDLESQTRRPQPGAPLPPPGMPEAWTLRTTEVLSRLSTLPDVVSVAAVNAVPFIRPAPATEIRSDSCPVELACRAEHVLVAGEYFRTMGMTLLRGRPLAPADRNTPSAVVSHVFEQRYLDGDAIGRRFALARRPDNPYVVVGVVSDVPAQEFSDERVPTFYRSSGVLPSQFMVRTSRDAAASLPVIRQAFRDYDPRFVVTATTTMEERLARSVALERFRALLSSVFGGAALVLAVVGLYALAARRVADRRHELGVRVAMGARPSDLRRLVLRDGVKTLTLGLLAGLPAAIVGSQMLRSLLFGVSPTAPHVFLIAFATLAVAAIVAWMIPARRASRIDVVETLRT